MNAGGSSLDEIDQLLARLSLDQKVRLISGANVWSTHAEPAIGLHPIVLSDGPAGVRGVTWDESDPSICLPCPTAMAATWNETLVARLSELIAAEARRKGVHVVLGPMINLQRTPLAGRHFECFSEDPLLTSRIAVAYIRALQSRGVAACPKHYVGNDSETDRWRVDVRIGDRALRELYLAPFEQVVTAGAWTVMAAYNSVNGHTMTESPLLTSPLKDEWGFDGVVVSDWLAVRTTARAAAAGTDLAMPGPCDVWGTELVKAVQSGQLSEEVIDDKVRRILRLAVRVGALEEIGGAHLHVVEDATTSDAAELLREAAASAMVLLRNQDNLLPLDRTRLRRLAIIGPNAGTGQIGGGGSAQVLAPYIISPLEGLRSALGDSVDVIYCPGVTPLADLTPAPLEQLTNSFNDKLGVHVRFLDVDGNELRVEERATSQLIWFGHELTGVASLELQTHFHPQRDGQYVLGVTGLGTNRLPGTYRLMVGDAAVEEVLEPSDDGQLFRSAGPLICTVTLKGGEPVNVVASFAMRHPLPQVNLTLCAREATPRGDEQHALAVAAAREADIAIVVVGTGPQDESEGFDRRTLTLPDNQNDLIRAIALANSRTIVVINAGAPVELPWHTDVPAVLLSWFPGQEFGNALADVLLGSREPEGRLPTTWMVREKDVPVMDVIPKNGRLDYEEGLNVGYRARRQPDSAPMYAFGHGLGYTEWRYDSLYVPDQIAADKATYVKVRLTNTGRRKGREVVQAYATRSGSVIDRPRLWLAGFAPVTAGPGEEVEVRILIEPRAFQHWISETHAWGVEPGDFSLFVGSSAASLPLSAQVYIP